jgi:hypothetical protein
MKKDIITIAVEQASIVVLPREGDVSGELWDVYLVNESDQKMESVLVSSRGYGELDGREKTTTTLRYFFQEVAPKSAVLVEPIQTTLFEINNEYWVSFNQGQDMLDRKFLFPADSIEASSLDHLDVINRKGMAAK